MKKEVPVQFANTAVRAGKDVAVVPLHRPNDGPREPAARLCANKRIPWFLAKTL